MPRDLKSPGQTKEFEARKNYKTNRKWYHDFTDLLRSRDFVLAVMGVMAIAPLILPQIFDITRFVFFFVFLWFWLANRKIKLPLKIPAYAKIPDYNDPKPGRSGYFKASGILYMGNDINDYELWLRDTDLKTHMLIYGTTGSGKTVSLQSISYNAFVMGTGLVYIDPKGSPSLAHELFVMARRVNREDDFLILNFMTGGKKSSSITPFRISNTTNPFANAPADSITNLLSSLLPSDDGGGNSVFKQKALALLTALIPVLTAIRDAKKPLPLTNMETVTGINKSQHSLGSGMSIKTIEEYLNPSMAVSLVYPMVRKLMEGESFKDPNPLPDVRDTDARKAEQSCLAYSDSRHEYIAVKELVNENILNTLKSSLSSVNLVTGNGPNECCDVAEQDAFQEQFGYAKGYFGQPLASISGTFGHLFNVTSGEIDMYDVLFNRRILVSILPSLEKSPLENESLGKIILASVKNSVSGGLGDKIEGKMVEVTGALPSASNVPGIIVVDEYAAIMMPGFEVIMTQARSLGFMAIVASQDYSGMKGKDQKSCDQIIENTKIKLFMKLSSAGETWNLAKNLFGDICVEEANLNEPEKRGQFKSTGRVVQEDLMTQVEGEFHAFYSSACIVGATPYMVPSKNEDYVLRINRFLRTDTSPEKVKIGLERLKEERKAGTDNRNEYEEWLSTIKEKMLWPNFYSVKVVKKRPTQNAA